MTTRKTKSKKSLKKKNREEKEWTTFRSVWFGLVGPGTLDWILSRYGNKKNREGGGGSDQADPRVDFVFIMMGANLAGGSYLTLTRHLVEKRFPFLSDLSFLRMKQFTID